MSEDPDAVVDHRSDLCACCDGALRKDLSSKIVSVVEFRLNLRDDCPIMIMGRVPGGGVARR